MIEVRNISRSWGGFSLRNVSLSVERGQCFAILGPCGSGKTLLLETIAGLHDPKEGMVLINGRDVTSMPPERRRIGLVYQQYALFPHLSVEDNITYGLRYQRLPKAEMRSRIDEMLDLFDIRRFAGRRTPRGLSGGEAQKVALARALAVRPEALLLDEPMSSLDTPATARVVELLNDVKRRLGVPIIYVTHDYAEAVALADRLAVFRDGEVAQTGAVDDLFHRPASRFVAEFLGVENILEGECISGDGVARVRIGDLEVKAPGPPRPGPVDLCIRPENVRIGAQGDSNNNSFRGRVREVSERGFSVRLVLEAGSVSLICRAPRGTAALSGVTAGSEVFVSLPVESLHIMSSGKELCGDEN